MCARPRVFIFHKVFWSENCVRNGIQWLLCNGRVYDWNWFLKFSDRFQARILWRFLIETGTDTRSLTDGKTFRRFTTHTHTHTFERKRERWNVMTTTTTSNRRGDGVKNTFSFPILQSAAVRPGGRWPVVSRGTGRTCQPFSETPGRIIWKPKS